MIISTHAPRGGSDTAVSRVMFFGGTFQLTLPVWGATKAIYKAYRLSLISTHAPRVGSDAAATAQPANRKISTHAPRVGSDHKPDGCDVVDHIFQLTLPVWGATYPGQPLLHST